MTNEIQTAGAGALATKNDTAILDISVFEGFDLANLTPSNLILVQGKTDLKKKVKAEDGDFVADNMNLTSRLEIIFIGSKKYYDTYKNADWDKVKKKLTKESEYVGTIVQGTETVKLTGLDHDKNPMVFKGHDNLIYQSKIVFALVINGMPYRMVFKSRSKQISAHNLHNTIIKSIAANKLMHPAEAVFDLFSEERQGEEGPYFTIGCSFARKASDEEIAGAAKFINKLDLQSVYLSEEASF